MTPMTPKERQQAQDALELTIDKHGLDEVLNMLESICYEKADHLRTNWQDERTAKWFDRVAKKLSKIQGEI